MEVISQKTQADATRDRGNEWPDVSEWQQSEIFQAKSVDAQRPLSNSHNAASESVESVNQVHGVRQCKDPQCGNHRQD